MNVRVVYRMNEKQMRYYDTDVKKSGLTLYGIDKNGKRINRVIYENESGCEYVRWRKHYRMIHEVVAELDKAWVFECDTAKQCIRYVKDTLGGWASYYDFEGIAKAIFWHNGERYCLLDQYRSTDGLRTREYQAVLDRFCWDTTYELSFTRGELADMAPGLKPEEYDELARYLIKNWKDNMKQDVDALNW